jgi:hypothetical protein
MAINFPGNAVNLIRILRAVEYPNYLFLTVLKNDPMIPASPI